MQSPQAFGQVQERLRMSDDFDLFCRRWPSTSAAERVVLFMHGIEVHSGAFQFMGPELANFSTEVYAFDRRGFGNSKEPDLPRGDTHGFDRHLQDIDEVVSVIHNRNPGKKLYVFGHSIGCAYTLWYAAYYPDQLDGLILASPPLETGFKLSTSDTLQLAAAPAIQHHKMFDLIDKWPEAFRRSEEYALITEDPLCTREFGLGYLFNVQTKLVDKMPETAAKINKPVQIMHGESDVIALPSSSTLILEKFASTDKNLHVFGDADHWFYQSIIPKMSAKYSVEQKRTVSEVVKNWLRVHP